jgi:hypothetical protein
LGSINHQNQYKKESTVMKKLQLLAIATVALLAAPVASFASHWTSVCSAGAIDESSFGRFAFINSSLTFAGGATGNLSARYNVTNTSVPGDNTPPYTTLELGSLDTSTYGSIRATLYEVNPCTGALIRICSVVSTTSSFAHCNTCTFPNTTFNFSTHVYYVIVDLLRTSSYATIQANSLRIY